MVSLAFRKQLQGYGLTTAQIFYRIPDYQRVIQTYVWQEYDLYPEFPELKRFLEFWTVNIEGPLYKVEVSHSRLISPAEMKIADGIFRLN